MDRIYHKICPECNTQFTSNSTGRKYCCDACKQKGKRRVGAEYRQRKKEEEKIKPIGMTLAEIGAAAKAEGLSYGKYVREHGL